MTSGEYLAIGSFAIAIIGTIGGFTWKISNSIRQVADEQDQKHKRIFERIDETKKDTVQKLDDTKKEMEIKLQSKEICGIHTDSVRNSLIEIKQDLKTLLKKNGIG